jgi:hypothetical protein
VAYASAGPKFTLEQIFELGLDASAEFIEQLAASAKQELAIEDTLKKIAAVWEALDLDIGPFRTSHKIRSTEDVNQALEDNVVTLGAMKTSRYYKAFATQVDRWERTLSLISETLDMMLQVQRAWMYLESIFGTSEDIRRMLPNESTYVVLSGSLISLSLCLSSSLHRCLSLSLSLSHDVSQSVLRRQRQVEEHHDTSCRSSQRHARHDPARPPRHAQGNAQNPGRNPESTG